MNPVATRCASARVTVIASWVSPVQGAANRVRRATRPARGDLIVFDGLRP